MDNYRFKMLVTCDCRKINLATIQLALFFDRQEVQYVYWISRLFLICLIPLCTKNVKKLALANKRFLLFREEPQCLQMTQIRKAESSHL